MYEFSSALSIVAICVVSYYGGIYLRYYRLPDLSDTAILSIRFAALPLILVVGVVMASQLNAAREGFKDKQAVVEDMAGLAIQIDRALTYYGTPAAKAQTDFREYLRHLLQTPEALWGGVDRNSAEQFAIDFQTLPVPAKDTGVAASTKKFLLDLMGRLSLDRYRLATLSVHDTKGFTASLLAAWLAVIFLCVGITSEPLSGAAFWASLAIATCVGSMQFVVYDFDNARRGLIQVSSAPFDRVLKEITPAQQ